MSNYLGSLFEYLVPFRACVQTQNILRRVFLLTAYIGGGAWPLYSPHHGGYTYTTACTLVIHSFTDP